MEENNKNKEVNEIAEFKKEIVELKKEIIELKKMVAELIYNKSTITNNIKDKIKDYKRISTKYKEKNIYPEINNSEYIYYKNNMEDELDR
jgi:phage host-nuclease inhibitor protein Gam